MKDDAFVSSSVLKKVSLINKEVNSLDYYETHLRSAHIQRIAGCDEVGRGCLAGPVVAAAVILPFPFPFSFSEVRDSKQVSAKKREELSELIKEHALSWSIQEVSVREIDEMNILQASLLAMKKAVNTLGSRPDLLLVDGNQPIDLDLEQICLIKGDSRSRSVAAASILAKVYRDHLVSQYDVEFPQYHFSQHKGYGTKIHLEALDQHGVTDYHRKSFAPVRTRICK